MKIEQQSQIELSVLQMARAVAEARTQRDRKDKIAVIDDRIATLESNIDRLKESGRKEPRVKQTIDENGYELAMLASLGDFLNGDTRQSSGDEGAD